MQDWNLLLCGQVCYLSCYQGNLQPQQLPVHVPDVVSCHSYKIAWQSRCTKHLCMTCGLQGLAEHRDELGAPLCPCRHYDDKAAEAKQGFGNCPCVPMRERKVKHNLFASFAIMRVWNHQLVGSRMSLHLVAVNAKNSFVFE